MTIYARTNENHSSVLGLPSSNHLYITDHPDDFKESLQFLFKLYFNLRSSGFSSVRYDWRWNLICSEPTIFNQQQLDHYRRVKETMDAAGLNSPTIVLSSPPSWASKIYKAGKMPEFLAAYKTYVERVAVSLARAGGQPINIVQVSNELNNRLYNRIRPEDMALLCETTRSAFRPYFGEIKLLATVLALPKRPLIEPALPFLREHRDNLESNFDIIGVDYYPGVWHWPRLREASRALLTTDFDGYHLWEAVIGNTNLLESLYKEVATWQTSYELAEVGWTSHLLLGGESGQQYCYDAFFDAYKIMLARLSKNGIIKQPERVGFYSARDEVTNGLLRYAVRRQRWGLYDSKLRPKATLRALMH